MTRIAPGPFIVALAVFLGACAAGDDAQAPLPAKRIALTYDDAPLGVGPALSGPERTDALIAELARADVEAAIFVTTQGLDTEAGHARVRAYAEAGHRIANHSHAHGWSSALSPEEFGAEVDRAESALAGLPNRRPWFRFPYLDEGQYVNPKTERAARRDAFAQQLRERGLMNAYVTADTFDWHLDTLWKRAVEAGASVDADALEALYVAMVVDAAEHADRLSRDTLGRQAAHVLLLHENDLAARYTDEAVAGLRAAGWTIIDPDTAFADPIADVRPDTLFAGRGRIAAMAMDAGAERDGRFTHWSADRDLMEARVAETNVFGDPVP